MKIIIYLIIIISIAFNDNFKAEQIKLLKEKHRNLINIFSSVDEWNYTIHSTVLEDKEIEKKFNDALDIYNLTLSIALSNPDFISNTSINIINKYKNDSKYFSELKALINKSNSISILNTYSYEENEQYEYNEDSTPFEKYRGKHVVYFKYGKLNKFGSSSSSYNYDFGNSFNFMLYSPRQLKLFGLDFILGYSINHSLIPATSMGSDLSIQKINLHLLKYLKKIPLYIDISGGPMMNNRNIGGNFEFSLSYYIPVKAVDLSINITYEQFIDLKEDFTLDFGTQDLIGVNLNIGKSLIIE